MNPTGVPESPACAPESKPAESATATAMGLGTGDAPIDQELYDVVMRAVEAVSTKVREYQSTGRYVPRVAAPLLGTFNSGWANLTQPPTAADTDPTDVSRLFVLYLMRLLIPLEYMSRLTA